MRLLRISKRIGFVLVVVSILSLYFLASISNQDNVIQIHPGSQIMLLESGKGEFQLLDLLHVRGNQKPQADSVEVFLNVSVEQLAPNSNTHVLFNVTNHSIYYGDLYTFTFKGNPGFYILNLVLKVKVNSSLASNLTGSPVASVLVSPPSITPGISLLTLGSVIISVTYYLEKRFAGSMFK